MWGLRVSWGIMSLGLSQAKTDIDNTAGFLCTALRDDLSKIKNFQAFLAATGTTGLQALGYTEGEATALTTCFTVLDDLRQVYEGTLAVPSPVNVAGFVQPLIGVQ